MKYYTVEIVTADGQTSQAIFERADLKAAMSAHHSVMSSALANPACTGVLSMVIGDDGGIFQSEHWSAYAE